jgi:hypothetical protein
MELYQIIFHNIAEQCQTTSYDETLGKTIGFLESLYNTNIKCNTQPYCNSDFCEVCQVSGEYFIEFVEKQIQKLKDDKIIGIRFYK